MNFQRLLHRSHISFFLSSPSFFSDKISSLALPIQTSLSTQHPTLSSPSSRYRLLDVSPTPVSRSSSSFQTHRLLSTVSTQSEGDRLQDQPLDEETDEGETTDGWEEEEEKEPEIGDGGDGGGVMLQGVTWGERALSLANEALSQFGDDIKLYAFKTTPCGYVYVRLDKLSNKYGCPSMEELESYSQEYKKKLDEVGERGEIPDDLALEVSTPGAERIVKVPEDLDRFKDMPMRVCYVDDVDANGMEKNGVFLLDSVILDSANCVWKLANVKENRDPLSKGRPLSRKRKDWRLNLPYSKHKRVTLYLEY